MVPETSLSALYTLIHLILITTLLAKYYFFPIIEKETETQRKYFYLNTLLVNCIIKSILICCPQCSSLIFIVGIYVPPPFLIHMSFPSMETIASLRLGPTSSLT